MNAQDYERFARLFDYPEADYASLVSALAQRGWQLSPRLGQPLSDLEALLPLGDAVALEELYTRTFTVQPITNLEIGYTLFGEDYKRGALLANLSREHQQAGTDCGGELADHLSNVLRLLPRLEPTLGAELVRVLLAPAVREMIREFSPERLAKKEALYKKHHKAVLEAPIGERRVAYQHALEALQALLQRDYALPVSLPMAETSTLTSAMSAELRIEDEQDAGQSSCSML